MTKIFEALQRVEEPLSTPTGRRSSLAGKTEFPPALEMEDATRGELTRLVQSMFLRPGGLRAVAFAGVEPGAGCSWLLVRIAELLGDANAGTVCVVDANLRSPALHTSVGADHGYGLSDALMGTDPIESYVQRLGSGRLRLLSSGSTGEKAEPLLASTAFQRRVDELRAKFDYVIFDTPAVSMRSDALAVASRVDGLALVVEANSTRREAARKALQYAAAANVRMLGVILNQRTYPMPEALYNRL